MKTKITISLLSTLCLLALGCARLQPGADPIVVRAEQAQQIALSTFDTFLKVEHSHRDFARAKLPEVHAFAEWLRQPVASPGLGEGQKPAPPEPRGVAIIASVDRVRLAYKQNRTPENKASLISALAALEAALAETQRHISTLNTSLP